jgi:hypothetical protein
MCIPNGWKTIEQAAAQIGISTQEVHHWALNISPNGDHTPEGLPPKEEETEIVLKGINTVRTIGRQLIINNKVVEGWMKAQQHGKNLHKLLALVRKIYDTVLNNSQAKQKSSVLHM